MSNKIDKKQNITIYMITYSKNIQRIENFNKINNLLINNVNYFEAIDTINNYEHYKLLGLSNNYITPNYINYVEKNGLGKLGCNLSHQFLFEKIENNYNSLENKNKWYLILEDDLELKGGNESIMTFLTELIQNINTNTPTSKYVQLCIYDNFFAEQVKQSKIFTDTFKKIPQYGTCAYLIHIDAIKILNKQKPFDNNIDFVFNKMDKTFNSLATFNPYFNCNGSQHSQDKNTKMGSIIWNN
jgi:GR25 family glycosyltransferase involved in LPS biosynthesis